MTEPKSFKSYDSGVEPREDVVARARKWLASFQKAVASRDHIGHRYSAVAAGLVPELVAEVERLQTAGPWMQHVERERAMKRERDGDCTCNRGPDTDGPDEFCPWHGREYRYLVDSCVSLAAEVEKLRGQPGCCCGGCCL